MGYGFVDNGIREKNLYFYHPDHLGSSSYIILTYDNWYCERNQNETYSDFVNRSIEYTNIYINNYNIEKGDLYFELVI